MGGWSGVGWGWGEEDEGMVERKVGDSGEEGRRWFGGGTRPGLSRSVYASWLLQTILDCIRSQGDYGHWCYMILASRSGVLFPISQPI